MTRLHAQGPRPAQPTARSVAPDRSHAPTNGASPEPATRNVAEQTHVDALAGVLQRSCRARALRGERGTRRSPSEPVLQRIVIKPTKTAKEVRDGTEVPFHDRPSEPYRETPLEETIFKRMKVDQTRHHIIPWNTLSAFARKAYEAGHAVHLKSALGVAIKTMMDNSPRYEGRRALAADEEGGTRKQGSVTVDELKEELRHTGEGALNSEALLAISTAYCWMPGNLFLGPLNTLRLDDPDEDFEGHADDQVPELERYRAAFAAIKDYVASEIPSGDAAKKIAGFLQWVAAKTEPIPFDESAWSQVSDHRVDDKGKERGASYYLNKAADTVQVRAKLQLIEAAYEPWYRKTVEETNAWHKAQQAVWAQQRAAAKVPVL